MNSKRILVFIDWFTPAFKAGGPIKSVSNIIRSLGDQYEFHVVTSDRDLGDEKALEGIQTDEWVSKENFKIIYLSPTDRKKKIQNILNEKNFDMAYFNSAFSKEFTLLPLQILKKLNLLDRAVVAPRGMFGKGALAIKPLKKKVFLKYARTTGLYKSVLWHATNEEEKQNIQKVFGSDIRVKIAGNLSLFKISKHDLSKEIGAVKLVFFSRVSPKKTSSIF